MTKAMELQVSSDLSIAEIETAVGFRSIGLFTAAFTRRVQMGPRDFARSYGTICARDATPGPASQL